MNGYKFDFTKKTFTMTKAFEKELNAGNEEAESILNHYLEMFPTMRIVRKTHASPKKSRDDKGLTYARMERYIKLHDNASELMETFEKVKEIAATQKNAYLYTKTWFFQQFPDYGKLPVVKEGKIMVLPVPAPAVEEAEAEEMGLTG